MTQIYFSKTLTIIAVAAMVIGCIGFIAVIIASKKKDAKAENISKMKKLAVAGNILVCSGMILFGISGISKDIDGYQTANLLGILAGGLFLLNGVKASEDVQRCEKRVRKEISPKEDFKYFENDVYEDIAETDSEEERNRLMKLYRIHVEKFLYFEDFTKKVYEGDVAIAASLVVLAISFLAVSVIRSSLLGAALFTVTCVMIIRLTIELKRKKEIINFIEKNENWNEKTVSEKEHICKDKGDVQYEQSTKLEEMDADHVAAWSRGGSSDISNCQMLCRTHNRAKGNH